MDHHASVDALGVAWRLGATLFFVLLNGFFVAAEFALVKVRPSRVAELEQAGRSGARGVQHILRHLDRYLSACQLGITLASLILGALGEPAVSVLIRAAIGAVGLEVPADAPWLPVISIGLAFALITTLHMTLGEQAPKMWALRNSESTALQTSLPLRAFAWTFGPFISAVNGISNAMLRLTGLPAGSTHEIHSHEEIRSILAIAARSGELTDLEHEITENVFRMMSLEVRHIIVPRVEVDYLSLERSQEENLRRVRQSRHSRLPLCEVGLDTVVGFVHAKDALDMALTGGKLDWRAAAREAVFVPDTMSVSDFLRELQVRRSHCAVVVDEHGTAIGLAFREDALEEVVGPLGDEFDELASEFHELGGGRYEMSGRLPLPEVCDRLEFELSDEEDESEDTIGGHVTARLGRLPRKGDRTRVGPFDASVLDATGRRVKRLLLERRAADEDEAESPEPPEGGGSRAGD